MSGHFVVDMAKLNLRPSGWSASAVRFQTQSSLPPRSWVIPGNARRSQSAGQAEVLLVNGKAGSGLVVRPAEPLRLTCGRDNPAIGNASRYLQFKRYRWSRLISLLASGFTAARVWSSTTTQMIATKLPFNYPRHLMLAAVTSPW